MKTTRSMLGTPGRVYSDFPENDNRESSESERRFLRKLNQTFSYAELVETCSDMESVIFSFLPVSTQLALSRTDKIIYQRHKKLRFSMEKFLVDCAANTGAVNNSDGYNLLTWFVAIQSRTEGLPGCLSYVTAALRNGNFSAFSKCVNYGRETRLWKGVVEAVEPLQQILVAAGEGGLDSAMFVLDSTPLCKADKPSFRSNINAMQQGAASKGDWYLITTLASRSHHIAEEVIYEASKVGDLVILAKIWHSLFSNSKAVDGFPLDIKSRSVDNATRSTIAKRMVKEAAQFGQLTVLSWMKDFGMEADVKNLEFLPTILAVGGEEVFLWYDKYYGTVSSFEKSIWNLPDVSLKALISHLVVQGKARVLELLHDKLADQDDALDCLYESIFVLITKGEGFKITPEVDKFLDRIVAPMLRSLQSRPSYLDENLLSSSNNKLWIMRHFEEINNFANGNLRESYVLFGNRDLPGLRLRASTSVDSWMMGSQPSMMLKVLREYDSHPYSNMIGIANGTIKKVLENHTLSYDLGPVLEYLLSFVYDDHEPLQVQVFDTLFGEKYWNMPPERLVLLWDLAIGLGFAYPTPSIMEDFLVKFFSLKNLKKRALGDVAAFSETLLGWLSGYHTENLPKSSLVILCLADFVEAAIARSDITTLFPKVLTLMEMGLELDGKTLFTALSTLPAFGLTYSDLTALTLVEVFKELTFFLEPLSLTPQQEDLFFASYSKKVLKAICKPEVLVNWKKAFGIPMETDTADINDHMKTLYM